LVCTTSIDDLLAKVKGCTLRETSTHRVIGSAFNVALAFLLIIVVASLAIGAYLWSSRKSTLSAEHLDQVTIATNIDYIGTCPVVVAHDKGFFTTEGILAIVQPYSSGKASMDAVLTGQADIGTVADIPIMFAGMNDQHISVIATIFKTEKDHGIVGRRDRGIENPVNLKGKRIGVTLSTSGHFALDAFLNRQRLSPGDVEMRNYPPEELSHALARGDVDAVATWEPYLATMRGELGNNSITFFGQDIYESLYSIAGMREYVTTHPETVKKLLRALTAGAQYCSEHPNAAHQLADKEIKADDAKGKVEQRPYQFDVVLDQSLLLALEDEARWAIKNKMSNRKRVPNYLNYVYLDGLESVAPEAVTIIH
jgi:NitT/TauT family transport system substrate-binding protein